MVRNPAMNPRVLVDAGNLHVGGGVQVASSFLEELFTSDERPTWLENATVRVSEEVRRNLGPEAASHVERPSGGVVAQWLRARPGRTQFDVAFRVFGPYYGPREATREVVGLADPYVPPGWAPDALAPHGLKNRLRVAVKRMRMRAADEIWVESEAFADAVVRIGVPRERIHVVPNTVSRTVRAEAAAGSGSDESREQVRLFFPARPYPHKNHAVLAPVLERLGKRGLSVTVDVTLTGKERDALLPGLADRINALGVLSLEEMAQAYTAADAVLFPTLLEVSSATPLEAMATARPLIASDRPFVSERVGEAAWYCDPTDPDSIADAVMSVFKDKALRETKIAEGLRVLRNAPTAQDRRAAFEAIIEGRHSVPTRGPRVLVVHPAQQHSMRTAVAVRQAGAELVYVTPVYDRAGSLTNRIKRLLSSESASRAERRKLLGLEGALVVQPVEWMGLMLLLLQRIPFTRVPFNWWFLALDLAFARRVARIGEQADAVIAYDTFSASLFATMKKRSPGVLRVLDMSAPYTGYVDRVLAAAAASPGQDAFLAGALRHASKGPLTRIQAWRAAREIALADHFLVASTFTGRSLVEVGVDPTKIHYCRYGVPEGEATGTGGSRGVDGRLRVAFVGTVTARKGATTFLSAAAAFADQPIDFVIIGQVPPEGGVTAVADNVEYTGYLTKESVLEQFASTDVMVFPSFADGFGFSALEAMASGCALVCSRNAGVSDLVEDGENGLLFDAGDVPALVQHLRRLSVDRGFLAQIAKAGQETARAQTWNSYGEDVQRMLTKAGVL
jgi:glycosyltransferase involved in cell wall biosynthesis